MDTILVVDDDAHIREVVRFALEKAGYAVSLAANGKQALEKFQQGQPAVLVLDILMPEMDGLEVCRTIRGGARRRDTPILFLSSKDDEIDRVVGLELGGDDYLSKPFSPRELTARVKAILRRTQATATPLPTLCHGQLMLDLERFEARWTDQPVNLTLTEFGILRTLMERPGKVCSREHLMNHAYELHKIVSERTIDSHVRRLRAKLMALGADAVQTVQGVGYKLGDV